MCRDAFTLLVRRTSIPLPIATAASTTAPAAPGNAFALTFAERGAFVLRLTEAFFFGRARVVILVRDRVLRDGVVCERVRGLARLAAATSAAASASASSFADSSALTLGPDLTFG